MFPIILVSCKLCGSDICLTTSSFHLVKSRSLLHHSTMHFSTFTWFQFGGLSFFFALVRLAILYAFIHPGCTSHVLGTFSARDEQTSSMSTSVLQPSATSLGLKRMVDSTKNYIDVAAGFLVLMNLGSVKKEKDEDISASRINGFHRSHQEKWRMLFHDLGACIDCWASGIKKNQLVFVRRSWILMLQGPHCLSWLFFFSPFAYRQLAHVIGFWIKTSFSQKLTPNQHNYDQPTE